MNVGTQGQYTYFSFAECRMKLGLKTVQKAVFKNDFVHILLEDLNL
jgi:hypothetical protein